WHDLKAEDVSKRLLMSGGVKLGGFTEPPTWVSFSGDGKRLATFHPAVFQKLRLWLWDAEKGNRVQQFEFGDKPLGLMKLSHKGDLIATTNLSAEEVRLWRDTQANAIHTLKTGS